MRPGRAPRQRRASDDDRHLLVAGGWLATLLACLQFDLGDREAAEASQSAAYTFARQAEHQELLAWTYELLAWWALVDRRYQEVNEYSRTGPEHHFVFDASKLSFYAATCYTVIGTVMILAGLWIAERGSDQREAASDPLKLSEDRAGGWERIWTPASWIWSSVALWSAAAMAVRSRQGELVAADIPGRLC